MSRILTFILGTILGLILSGGVIWYVLLPKTNNAPRGTVIQPPDTQGSVPGTASIELKEDFFNPVVQSIFNQENPPAFPLSLTRQPTDQPVSEITCGKIILKPEGSGAKTAVLMRNGQIFLPLAFSGNINALGNCYEFNGSAETTLELRYDEKEQTVFGHLNVQTVNLDGVSPVVGGLLTPLVQSTINNKFNPVEILRGDKIAFKVPIKSSGNILIGTVKDIRAEVKEGSIILYLSYDFRSEKQTPEAIQQ